MLLLMAQQIYTSDQLAAAGAIVLFLLSIIAWVVWGARNSEDLTTFQTTVSEEDRLKSLSSDINAIRILRGGALLEGRLKFKVKVVNESQYSITEGIVKLDTYPKESLELAGIDEVIHFVEIAPGKFKEPSFEFITVQEKLVGEIIASVRYIDINGNSHLLTTRSYSL